MSDYLLGSSNEEVARLGLQHRLWHDEMLTSWDRAGFKTGSRVLDIGCGPGFSTLELAKRVGPSGEVLAVDTAAGFLSLLTEESNRQGLSQIKVIEARAEDLDLKPGSLDGIYARWFFLFIPDPATLIGHLRKSLRPGGHVVIQDYADFGAARMGPHSPVMDKMLGALCHSFRLAKANPQVGLVLPGLLHSHGFTIRGIRPIIRVIRPHEEMWKWPESFLASYGPKVVAAGVITEQEWAQFNSDWERTKQQGESGVFFLTAPMVEIIATL